MKEVNLEIPPLLSGCHLLTRAGVPRWTRVQIKAMRAGELEYEKASRALIRMFGADHKPNARDLGRALPSSTKDDANDAFYENEVDEWFEEPYDEGYSAEELWYEDEIYEVGDYDEEHDVPEELEEAMDQADAAYVSYVESRKRMKELALSSGGFESRV